MGDVQYAIIIRKKIVMPRFRHGHSLAFLLTTTSHRQWQLPLSTVQLMKFGSIAGSNGSLRCTFFCYWTVSQRPESRHEWTSHTLLIDILLSRCRDILLCPVRRGNMTSWKNLLWIANLLFAWTGRQYCSFSDTNDHTRSHDDVRLHFRDMDFPALVFHGISLQ